jgi:hypothetical protein
LESDGTAHHTDVALVHGCRAKKSRIKRQEHHQELSLALEAFVVCWHNASLLQRYHHEGLVKDAPLKEVPATSGDPSRQVELHVCITFRHRACRQLWQTQAHFCMLATQERHAAARSPQDQWGIKAQAVVGREKYDLAHCLRISPAASVLDGLFLTLHFKRSSHLRSRQHLWSRPPHLTAGFSHLLLRHFMGVFQVTPVSRHASATLPHLSEKHYQIDAATLAHLVVRINS